MSVHHVYPGCIVAGSDWEITDDIDTETDGRYKVDVEWEDDFCFLTLAGES